MPLTSMKKIYILKKKRYRITNTNMLEEEQGFRNKALQINKKRELEYTKQ